MRQLRFQCLRNDVLISCCQVCRDCCWRRSRVRSVTRNAQDRAKNIQTIQWVSTWSLHFSLHSSRLIISSVREFVPNVIEPSFGIGRILYSLLEHSYWARKEDVDRGVSRLCASMPKRFSFKFGVVLGSVLAALGCSDKGFDRTAQRERGVRSAYPGSL